jgi:ergothioneine biosynthesis protein EgtB
MLTRALLAAKYESVRELTLHLVDPLSAEDQCVQAMPDTSPTKWHLGHTSWFFEAVVLRTLAAGYAVFDERYLFLFNSYYEGLGPRQPRPRRGMITRPGLEQVFAYRRHVDLAMERFFSDCDDAAWRRAAPLIELGLNHEQQHQELVLTDIKYTLSLNPYEAIYAPLARPAADAGAELRWLPGRDGEIMIGHAGDGFAYDNESPRHKVFIHPHQLANRLVTCGEYQAFMNDGGYERAEFWLSDGWAAVCTQNWRAPLYWRADGPGKWSIFTLHGYQPLDPDEPVCHVSYYEAAAYAAWSDARLPTEFEWEAAAADLPVSGRFLDLAGLHPRAAIPGDGLIQAYGDAWNWTRSSYDPYPGFKPLPGVAAEYNGKFMVGQLVLRGGSCVTPPGHMRPSYRNFFPPAARWQFSGIRLARDI